MKSQFTPEMLLRAEKLIALYPTKRSALLPLCHLAQEQAGYLTRELMEEIASLIGISPAEVLGTASFYDMFHTEPVGKYLIGICTNIACLLQGADLLLEHAEQTLGLPVGGTSNDSMFTLEELECVAHCDKAPCAQVNYRFFGPLDNSSFDDLVQSLRDGDLVDTVPPHGTLIRVQREPGIEVALDDIVEERRRSDLEISNRAAIARAAAEKVK